MEREGKHIYRGAVVDGEYEGYGECTYTDGASYAGSWRAGKWHGRGKLTMADGGTYEGGFEEGERHGKGVLLASAAVAAVGALDVETGVYTIGVAGTPGLEDGAAVAEYDGGWARGAMAGAGRLALRSGETYEGQFEAGRYHGRGVLCAAGGRETEGDFAEGVASGDACTVLLSGGGLALTLTLTLTLTLALALALTLASTLIRCCCRAAGGTRVQYPTGCARARASAPTRRATSTPARGAPTSATARAAGGWWVAAASTAAGATTRCKGAACSRCRAAPRSMESGRLACCAARRRCAAPPAATSYTWASWQR